MRSVIRHCPSNNFLDFLIDADAFSNELSDTHGGAGEVFLCAALGVEGLGEARSEERRRARQGAALVGDHVKGAGVARGEAAREHGHGGEGAGRDGARR